MNDPQSPPRTEAELRTIAMPADTNRFGDIFGGWLLAQMDLTGGSYAMARTGGRVATVGIEAMSFHRPVYVGDRVSCHYRTEPHRPHLDHRPRRDLGAPHADRPGARGDHGHRGHVHLRRHERGRREAGDRTLTLPGARPFPSTFRDEAPDAFPGTACRPRTRRETGPRRTWLAPPVREKAAPIGNSPEGRQSARRSGIRAGRAAYRNVGAGRPRRFKSGYGSEAGHRVASLPHSPRSPYPSK